MIFLGFRDRREAGNQLSGLLSIYRDTDAVIITPMDGSIIIGQMVSVALGIPHRLLMVSPVSHPEKWDEIVGVVTTKNQLLGPPFTMQDQRMAHITGQIRERLIKRAAMFNEQPVMSDMEGKIIILIVEGIRTGKKLLPTMAILQEFLPSLLVVASPAAAPNVLPAIRSLTDGVHTLMTPLPYQFTSDFYYHFPFISDEKLAEIYKAAQQ